MPLIKVTSGENLPIEFNVIIEIPSHSDPIKYEVDKESGALFVDRFMLTSMHYPCLLYTSPSPRDGLLSRMPSSA